MYFLEDDVQAWNSRLWPTEFYTTYGNNQWDTLRIVCEIEQTTPNKDTRILHGSIKMIYEQATDNITIKKGKNKNIEEVITNP